MMFIVIIHSFMIIFQEKYCLSYKNILVFFGDKKEQNRSFEVLPEITICICDGFRIQWIQFIAIVKYEMESILLSLHVQGFVYINVRMSYTYVYISFLYNK